MGINQSHAANASGLAVLLVVFAFAIVVTSASLVPAACGENREPCGATSSPMLASTLAFIGLAGVVIALLLMRRGRRGAATVVGGLTVAIYASWLVAFVFEVRLITDERGYRSRASEAFSSPEPNVSPVGFRPST